MSQTRGPCPPPLQKLVRQLEAEQAGNERDVRRLRAEAEAARGDAAAARAEAQEQAGAAPLALQHC